MLASPHFSCDGDGPLQRCSARTDRVESPICAWRLWGALTIHEPIALDDHMTEGRSRCEGHIRSPVRYSMILEQHLDTRQIGTHQRTVRHHQRLVTVADVIGEQ